MTPGRAAELWRPPIKLFAFDLILSFLPPGWIWTGEHMDKHRHTSTKVLPCTEYCNFPHFHHFSHLFSSLRNVQISAHECNLYFCLKFILPFVLVPSPKEMHETSRRITRPQKKKKETLKHVSEKMMMEQLCENSLACSQPAYQVIFWCYKFHPCHQPQFLPLSLPS